MSTLNRTAAALAIHELALGDAGFEETLDRLETCVDPDPRIDAIERTLDASVPGAGLSEFQIRTLLAGGHA